MSKLISLLNKQRMTLIVQLPQATADFAAAAEAGGADAICLEADEMENICENISKVSRQVKIPVGISIHKSFLEEKELKVLEASGADFAGIRFGGSPEMWLKLGAIGKIAVLGHDYSAYDITDLHKQNIDALEAAISSEEEMGKELKVGDLQHFITLCLSTGLPVIVPTQKLIRASEVPIIWDTGAKGIMLDETVTGNTAGTIKAVTKEFKEAIQGIQEEE